MTLTERPKDQETTGDRTRHELTKCTVCCYLTSNLSNITLPYLSLPRTRTTIAALRLEVIELYRQLLDEQRQETGNPHAASKIKPQIRRIQCRILKLQMYCTVHRVLGNWILYSYSLFLFTTIFDA